MDFEFFDTRPLEHRASDADHAGTNVLDTHLCRLRGQVNERERGQHESEGESP
jgi:hypothetical protein